VPCAYEIRLPDRGRVERILGRMQDAMAGAGSADVVEAKGLLLELLAMFIRTADAERLAGRRERWLRFRNVLEHIDAHLGEAMPVKRLATVAHMERTHFSRVFRRHFGVGPAAYVRRKRIERAKGLLWEGNDTLDVIAERLGFSDGFHFSKVFKQMTGGSPREFRAQPRRVP